MKKEQVMVGGKYLACVSGVLVPVTVVRETQVRHGYSGAGYEKYTTAFVVRTKEGRELPKPRRAASLRKTVAQAIAESIISWGAAMRAQVSS